MKLRSTAKWVSAEVEIMRWVLTNFLLWKLDEEAGKWQMLFCADKVENFEYFYGGFRHLVNNNNKGVGHASHMWTVSSVL